MARNIHLTVFKWLILSLLIGYSAWISIWAHRQAERRVCNGIEIKVDGVNGNDSIIRKGILANLDKFPDKIKGTPIYRLNVQKIEKYLSDFSNFENVECMMNSAQMLEIRVVPMVPVMRIFSGDKSYYVNRSGKKIEANAEFFMDVPVVRGNFNRDFSPVDVYPIVKFVENDPELKNIVSMFEARDKNNILLVPYISGHIINFGDTTDLPRKRDALTLFYHRVIPYKGWNEYDTISVKFRGQVVATRADKTKQNIPEEDYSEEIEIEEAALPTGNRPGENASTDVKVNNKQTANAVDSIVHL